MSDVELRRPTAVYLLALLFLCAPVGNLLLSFANSGVPQWYSPDNLMNFMSQVSILDWCWLGLVFVTGILLFKPHKATWGLAILCLFVVVSINSYRVISGDLSSQGKAIHTQLFFSIAISCVSLMIMFYSRFPYLDRRTGRFLTAAHRYNARTPVSVVAQDIYEGVTASISISGALVHLQRNMEGSSADLRFVDVIFPEIRNVKIKARVVEYRDNNLRLKFKDLRGTSRTYMLDWLHSQNETQNR